MNSIRLPNLQRLYGILLHMRASISQLEEKTMRVDGLIWQMRRNHEVWKANLTEKVQNISYNLMCSTCCQNTNS